MSLYQKLYRYRQQANRNPLEDFLNESLVDLLNRLPNKLQLEFVTFVLLSRTNMSLRWRQLVTELTELNWVTQKTISHQTDRLRLDILLQSRGRPTLVVESKIGSPLRTYRKASRAETIGPEPLLDERSNQLQRYGLWLSGEMRPTGWPGALVYLTFISRTPEDFGNGDSVAYGVPIQGNCSWHQVSRWLERMVANRAAGSVSAPWPAYLELARELHLFMRDHGMSGETFTLNDISICDLYFGAIGRFEAAFVLFRQTVEDTFGMEGRTKVEDWGEGDDPGILWQYFYLSAPYTSGKKEWYVAWGFRFPTRSLWWKDADPVLPDVPQFFICLASEQSKSRLPVAKLSSIIPAGWSTSSSGNGAFICAEPVGAFSRDDPSPAVEIASWLQTKVVELKTFIERL